MGTIRENLALNLRRLRTEAGLTLIELAKKANLEKGTINKWENQKQGFRLSNLKGVADALGVRPEDLIAEPVGATATASPETKSELLGQLVALLPALDEDQLAQLLRFARVHAEGDAASGPLVGDKSRNQTK